MLGVFGCIPAFDTNVAKFFNYYIPKDEGKTLISNNGVNEKTCNIINRMKEIDGFPDLKELLNNGDFETISFSKNKKGHRYTQAKLIDMYCFSVGQMLSSKNHP